MSIDRVLAEIREQADDLRRWADDAATGLFVPTDEGSVTAAYGEVIEWVNGNSQFTPAAKAAFARKADGWVVAYGFVHGLAVVTDEVFRPDVKRRVPVPNVCQQFNVSYVNTFSMLRTLQVRFDWRAP